MSGVCLKSLDLFLILSVLIMNSGEVARANRMSTLKPHKSDPAMDDDFLLLDSETETTQKLGRAMSESTALHMQRMMGRVTSNGTARKAFEGFAMSTGGKTGSAENPSGDAHAWFIGFAPLERPQVAVAVAIENGGSGGGTAAPIARMALEQAMRLGLLSP